MLLLVELNAWGRALKVEGAKMTEISGLRVTPP
jgi:hypothetical protein